MAWLHFLLAATMVVIVLAKGAPFDLIAERVWSEVDADELPDFVKDPYCPVDDDGERVAGGQTYTDVFEWFDCIRESRSVPDGESLWDDDTRQRLYTIDPQEVFSVPVWVLIVVFEALTCFFHYLLRWPYEVTYFKLVRDRMQPFRWVEYSITSSIMLWAILSLSRVRDVYTLFALFLCSAFLCLGGGLVFEVLRHAESKVEPHVRDACWYARWYLYALAWLAFVLTYVCIFDAFYTAIQPYFDLGETEDLWRQLFGFIQVLNFTLLAAYASFPVIQICETVGWPWGDRYEEYERAYLIASFVSKASLSTIVFVAALQRDED